MDERTIPAEAASVRAIRFWQKFVEDMETVTEPVTKRVPILDNSGTHTGEYREEVTMVSKTVPYLRAVDWVEFAARGNAKFTTTPMPVSHVQRMTDGTWECLAPAYEAWKKGQEIPVNGTPLAAWSGVSPEQAQVLKSHDVRTVEDIRDMTDGQLQKIGLPGLRTIRDAARAWDAAKDSRKVEAELRRKDEEIEALRAQMDEMMAIVQGRDNTEEPIKRKPGRPRKDAEDMEAA